MDQPDARFVTRKWGPGAAPARLRDLPLADAKEIADAVYDIQVLSRRILKLMNYRARAPVLDAMLRFHNRAVDKLCKAVDQCLAEHYAAGDWSAEWRDLCERYRNGERP